MSVRINIHRGFLRGPVEKSQTVAVSGNTVYEVLNHLASQLPEVKPDIFSESGEILPDTGIFVNGENVFPEEAAKPVREGDVIDLVPLHLIGG